MQQIYIITNLVNGKYYVGKTKKPNLQKYLRDAQSMARRGFKNRPLLHRAFRKYGEVSFIIEPLATCETNEHATVLERLWIALLAARNSTSGYNISSGGEGSPDCKHSLEVRAQQSLRRKGQIPWNKGLKYKNPNAVKRGTTNSFFGKTHTKETGEKIARSNSRRVWTPKMRENMGLVKTGFIFTEDSRKKMSVAAQARLRIGGRFVKAR